MKPAGVPTWFDLTTPDPERARAFYGNVFGWSFTEEGPAEMGRYTMALIEGKAVAGMGASPDPQTPPAWSVYFASDDVDADVARATELDAEVVQAPMDVGDNGRMAILADPTGAHFGLWQAGRHAGAEIEGVHGAMAWCEVNTRDAEAARDFYTALFGLSAKKMEDMDYYTLHHDDPAVAGVLQMDAQWEGLPPHWMVYFRVDDVDTAATRVSQSRGRLHHGPFETPYGRIAVIGDPLGATLSLLQPPAPS